MKILGREAISKYAPGLDLLHVELMLNEKDCVEGHKGFGTQLCNGDCQQVYFSMLFQNDEKKLASGITKGEFWVHVNEELCGSRGYGALPEQHAALCKEIINSNECTIEQLLGSNMQEKIDHFRKQLNHNALPACPINIKEKHIAFKKEDRVLDIYINRERVIRMFHDCYFMTSPATLTMATVYGHEFNEINAHKDELKKIAKEISFAELNLSKGYCLPAAVEVIENLVAQQVAIN